MTKRDRQPSLLDMAKENASRSVARSWIDRLPEADRQEILEAASILMKEKVKLVCLAKAIVDKYKVKVCTESIVRTITRRIGR